MPLVTSGEVTGFKPAEEDWVGRGCSSPVADDSILETPVSLEKVAFTSEQGDEIGARRVGEWDLKEETGGTFVSGPKNSCLQTRPPRRET